MSEHVNDCDCCQRKLAALRIAGTIDGIHLRQRDAYRDVLRDLIAELREAHHAEQYTLTDGHYCPICQTRASRMSSKSVDWPCDTARMADRAEARLREVSGDE